MLLRPLILQTMPIPALQLTCKRRERHFKTKAEIDQDRRSYNRDGLKVVEEYESDEIASDSEDEKRLIYRN